MVSSAANWHVAVMICVCLESAAPAWCFSVCAGGLKGRDVLVSSGQSQLGKVFSFREIERRRPHAALTLRAGNEERNAPDQEPVDAKEAALRRLAGADAPKGPAPKKVDKASSPLPEWTFFVLPIVGAACAFAVQYFTKAPLPLG